MLVAPIRQKRKFREQQLHSFIMLENMHSCRNTVDFMYPEFKWINTIHKERVDLDDFHVARKF